MAAAAAAAAQLAAMSFRVKHTFIEVGDLFDPEADFLSRAARRQVSEPAPATAPLRRLFDVSEEKIDEARSQPHSEDEDLNFDQLLQDVPKRQVSVLSVRSREGVSSGSFIDDDTQEPWMRLVTEDYFGDSGRSGGALGGPGGSLLLSQGSGPLKPEPPQPEPEPQPPQQPEPARVLPGGLAYAMPMLVQLPMIPRQVPRLAPATSSLVPATSSAAVMPIPARKTRRQRGRYSLIDLAKQQAQEAKLVQICGGGGAAAAAPAAEGGCGHAAVTVNFCPYCGAKAELYFRFCKFCGQSLAFGSNAA